METHLECNDPNLLEEASISEVSSDAAVKKVDAYFSADVETDGPIPGPYSILSFALVYAGSFDGQKFVPPVNYAQNFYRELRPISDQFELEALSVNKMDRRNLC